MTKSIDVALLRELRDGEMMSQADFEAEMRAAGLDAEGNALTIADPAQTDLVAELVPELATALEAPAAVTSIEDLARVELTLEREAHYEEQEAGAPLSEAIAEPAKPKKASKAALAAAASLASKAADKPAKPKKATTDSGAPKRGARVMLGSVGAYVASVMGTRVDLGEVEVEIAPLVDSLPKKVGEKAANIADHITRGSKLSVYTRLAIKLLESDGSLVGKKLVELYTTAEGKSYSIGTARSQAGQMTALFRKLGLVDDKGVANSNSALLPKLKAG